MTSTLDSEKQAIIKRLCEVATPEKIYLLGTVGMKRQISNIFAIDAPSCHYTAHYFLLVLESTRSEAYEVQERIESHCKPLVPISAIVLKTDEFRVWLTASHPFACTIVSRAELLYDNNTTPLPAAIPPSRQAQQQINRAVYNTSSKRVSSFLAGADLFRVRVEYGMAAFMLHQATECLLRTALHVLTGYYCNTHSLDKLSRFSGFLLWRLPEILERHKSAGEALFQLLQKAYIESRYRDNYKITLSELESLFTKVQQVSDHLKEVVVNSLAQE